MAIAGFARGLEHQMNDPKQAAHRIHLRPAIERDVPKLETLPFTAGLVSKHRDRFGRQQRDEVLYVLATQGADIIGHLLLKWDGPSHPHVCALISPCSEVEDFVVAPHLRGRGIGSEMLEYASSQSLERGVHRIGIAVGVGNPSARALYERCGFLLVPGSEHRVSWLARDDSGRQVREYEDCLYLVKDLV